MLKSAWKRWALLALLVMLASYWLLIFVATHLPVQKLPHTGVGNDKLQHLVAYAGLTFLLTIVWRLARNFRWREVPLMLLVPATYGVLDELTQSLVGRTTDLKDWVADCIGAVIGLVAGLLVYAMLRMLFKPHLKTSLD